jgi:predicted P-loop ATPase
MDNQSKSLVQPKRSPGLLSKCKEIAESGRPLVLPDRTRGGKFDGNSRANVEAFLAWAGIKVVYDEFERRTLAVGIPGMREWDDNAVRTVRMAANEFGLRMTAEFTNEAVLALALEYRMHPVREYLERCQATWDGVPRIDTWLIDYAQAEDTPFTRAVGAIFLIAGVRRIREPGCKFDTLLVLEGEQGSGKSSLGRVLAAHEEWFGDSLPLGADPKVTNELTAGKWIVEHAELTGITKSEVENVKAFLSRQVDEAREAYGRHKTRVPRQFVLIGTTNDDRYLMDTTGNRRFLPVRCQGGPGSIDVNRLAHDRDQLWGEAAAREAQGESLMLPSELWVVAAETQEHRRVVSPIEQTLTDFLEEIKAGFISHDDLRAAAGLRPGQVEQRYQKAIDETMKRLGWFRPGNAVKLPGNYRKRGWAKGERWRDAIWVYDEVNRQIVLRGTRGIVDLSDEVLF